MPEGDWRADRVTVTIAGERYRRVKVVIADGVARAFKPSGELLGVLEAPVRVPVSTKAWDLMSGETVWHVEVGGCCGG